MPARTRPDTAAPLVPPMEGLWQGAAILAAITMLLYAPLIAWGVPHATGPDRVYPWSTDDILPLGPLAELQNTFMRTSPDRNYGYPLFHYLVAGVIQIPYLAYLWLTGGLSQPTGVYPFGLTDPAASLWTLAIIGRLLTLVMAGGVVACVYVFARILWDRRTGIVAAILTVVSYQMMYYGRTGNVDVPAFFWTAVGLVVFATIAIDGLTTRRMIALAVTAGLAMATKDQALVVFLPLGCALLSPTVNRQPSGKYPSRLILLGLAASIAAYLAGTGMIVDPQRQITHVDRLFFHPEQVSVATSVPRHAATLSGRMGLIAEFTHHFGEAMSWPILVAAIAGLFVAPKRPWVRTIAIAALVLLLVILAFPTGVVVRRYFLPMIFFVNAFAAAFVTWLWQRSGRTAGIVAAALLCAWPAVAAADMSAAQWTDTRYAGSEWLAAHARPGDRIGYFGSRSHLLRFTPEMTTIRVPEAAGSDEDPKAIAAYLTREQPEYVLVIPDWTSWRTPEHSRDCPEEIFQGLLGGTLGYSLAWYQPARTYLPAGWRPKLDYPTIAPPVRIFQRAQPLRARPVEGRS